MKYVSNTEEESVHLEKTVEVLRENIVMLRSKADRALEVLEDTSALYAEGDAGFYMEIPAAQARYMDAIKDVEDTEKAILVPYFGKVIFEYDDVVNGSGDNIFYFGKKGLHDLINDNGEYTITDWRAPVAEIYYTSKLGSTYYQAPKGQIDVDLKLKTTIKIKNSELISLYDAEVVTNDELLSEYLSQNKDVVLNEIVATIQEDQNLIIRRPLSRNLIVQGVAGSGKTTVALHRIAYLLYNFKDYLKYDSVCLIASNKLFLTYVTGMLPDLDVPDIKQYTITELLLTSIRAYQPKFKCTLKDVDVDINPIYSNTTYVKTFREFVKDKVTEMFSIESVSLFGKTYIGKDEIQRVATADEIPWLEKAKILDGRIKERLVEDRSEILSYCANNHKTPEIGAEIDELFGLNGQYAFQDLLEQKFLSFCNKFKNIFTKIVKSNTPKKLFMEFTSSKYKKFDNNDLSCLLEIHTIIHGVEYLPDIRHVVIDEAQDFSIAIYSSLKSCYPKATFTLVGDIMQNIKTTGLESWDILKDEVLGKSTEYSSLVKSYRNTIEISNFAQKAVKDLAGLDIEIEPIIRNGLPVQVHPFVTPPEKMEDLIKIVKSFDEKNFMLNGIICRDENEASRLYDGLSKYIDVNVLDVENDKLQTGTYVLSVANAKGLEFDTVCVWDYDLYEKADVNKLYVALTRALHELYVFSNKDNF